MSKVWSIGVESPVTPQDPLPPMPELAPGELLAIEGRAPIWRYAMALHKAHGSAAGAVAVFDPRLGYVIVMSHKPGFKEGEILSFWRIAARERGLDGDRDESGYPVRAD